MSLEHLYEVLQRIYAQGGMPAFLMGVLATIAVEAMLLSLGWFGIRHLLRFSSRDLVRDLENARKETHEWREKVSGLTHDLEKQTARAVALELERRQVQNLNLRLDVDYRKLFSDHEQEKRERAKANRKRAEAEDQCKIFVDQLQAIQTSDHRIWNREPTATVPAFRSLALRRMPIVAVLNLKGGVGKTTITANLGAMLAMMKYRTLMIDSDYQGSLTNLVLDAYDESLARSSHRLLHRVLDKESQAERVSSLLQCISEVPDMNHGAAAFRIIAADDLLDPLESRLMMQWHTGGMTDDVRFRLRSALHDPRIAESYDFVLIDCPPRLSTSCANALAAADYVLVPVLLNAMSADAAPRLLKWLRALRPSFCPELQLLGIVGNRAYPRDRLIAREEVVWDALKGLAQDAWGSPVHHFEKAIIRDHSTTSHRLAALDERHAPAYKVLAQSIMKELPGYACRRFETVS